MPHSLLPRTAYGSGQIPALWVGILEEFGVGWGGVQALLRGPFSGIQSTQREQRILHSPTARGPHTLPKHGLPWPSNIDTFATFLCHPVAQAPHHHYLGRQHHPLLRKRDLGRAEERKGGSRDPLQRGPLLFPGIGGVYPTPLAGEARVNVHAWLKGPIIPPHAGHGYAHFPPNWKMQREIDGFRMLVVGMNDQWLLL